jgi:hypothetical protein
MFNARRRDVEDSAKSATRRSMTERVNETGNDCSCDGKSIGDFDAGDETMKTANGVHPEPAFPVWANCDAVAGEVTALSVTENSAKIKTVQGSLAAIEFHFGADCPTAFFNGPSAIL